MREVKFRAWDPIRKEMYTGYDLHNPMPYGFNYLIPMQYTGIEDKNGIPIYEGDLVEREMEDDGVWELYEPGLIVFNEEHAIYCFDWDAPCPLSDYRNLEVVGNIYENSELTK